MDRRRNPFFDHGEAAFWLAWRDGVPVGRISAQVNRHHLDQHRDETGNFGLFEAIDDPAVFAALLHTAEEWLRERGMRRILGPYTMTLNDEVGVLVQGFDSPPMAGLVHNPPYYATRLEAQGYTKAKDLHALRVTLSELVERHVAKLESVTAKLRADGRIAVRNLDPARFLDEMRLGIDIFNEAWADNWGFVPPTEREVRTAIKQVRPIIRPENVVFALADGEAAAVLVAVPNVNEYLADLEGRLFPTGWAKLLWRLHYGNAKTARVVLTGVRKRYRGSALSAALVTLMLLEILKVGQQRQTEMVELSWILEDNRPTLEGCRAIGARLAKLYRVYGKIL
jgi:hypothetical protein